MRDVLVAYKTKQPLVEKRHDLLKNVLEIPPAFLKNVSRLEAFLFLTYIALTAHALIERQLRLAMKREKTETLPFYPEERECAAPTMARVLELFARVEWHVLRDGRKEIKRFPPELSQLQTTTLRLLGITARAYSSSSRPRAD